MDRNITIAANLTVSNGNLFNCSLEDAWKEYTPNHLTDNFTFDQVKEYIDEKVKLGSLYVKNNSR
jgi:hypothetical protein